MNESFSRSLNPVEVDHIVAPYYTSNKPQMHSYIAIYAFMLGLYLSAMQFSLRTSKEITQCKVKESIQVNTHLAS